MLFITRIEKANIIHLKNCLKTTQAAIKEKAAEKEAKKATKKTTTKKSK